MTERKIASALIAMPSRNCRARGTGEFHLLKRLLGKNLGKLLLGEGQEEQSEDADDEEGENAGGGSLVWTAAIMHAHQNANKSASTDENAEP